MSPHSVATLAFCISGTTKPPELPRLAQDLVLQPSVQALIRMNLQVRPVQHVTLQNAIELACAELAWRSYRRNVTLVLPAKDHTKIHLIAPCLRHHLPT